jgi:hypothetical protein
MVLSETSITVQAKESQSKRIQNITAIYESSIYQDLRPMTLLAIALFGHHYNGIEIVCCFAIIMQSIHCIDPCNHIANM